MPCCRCASTAPSSPGRCRRSWPTARPSWSLSTRAPPSPSSRLVGASALVRGFVFAVGALLVLSGFTWIVATPGLAGTGLWLVALGAFLTIVAILERNRYRSEASEKTNDPIGPGGSETSDPVEVRFRPTDEVFVDPTSGVRMQV